jgi:hypothetical protein
MFKTCKYGALFEMFTVYSNYDALLNTQFVV